MNVQDILDAYESIRARTGALPDEVEVELWTTYEQDPKPLVFHSFEGKYINLLMKGAKP